MKHLKIDEDENNISKYSRASKKLNIENFGKPESYQELMEI